MELESNFLIKSTENSSFGTAFAIYTDVDGSYLLTAAHVVESCGKDNLLVDAVDSESQQIISYPSEVLYISESVETIDLALVYVKGLVEVKASKLSPEILEISDENHTFKIDGFRPHKGMYAKTPLSGYIRKSYTLQSNNNQTRIYDLTINQQDTIVQGYSGSAIVCTRSGLVLGIATDRNSSGKQAYATPACYLKKIWRELPYDDIFESVNSSNPYMGLESFHYEDQENYYGREEEAKEVAKIVKETKLFTLLGASGSGKSSFISAGLIPLVEEKESKIVTFRPLDNPFKSLVSIFMPMLYDDKVKQLQKEKLLSRELEDSKIDLLSLIEKCLEKERVKKLYIVIDQFEELFTLTKDKKLINTFLNQLLTLINSQHEITLLISMRSDFLAYLSYYELINKGFNKYPTYSLGLLSADNLKQVIERPALSKGVTFEPHLLSKIIEEVEDELGQLPLLQFALHQLWIHKEGSVITLNSLDKIGSISKSISQYADSVYNMNPQLQDSMKRIFLNLISPGAGSEDTKKIALQEAFSKEDRETILLLAQKRLITTNVEEVDNEREETIEIVHESLIREWKKLKEWIEEYREFLEWEQRVNSERIFYLKNGEKKEDLLHNGKLLLAKDFLAQYRDYVTVNNRDFIEKSMLKEKQNKRNRNVLFTFAFVSLLGVASVMWTLKNRADTSTKKAFSVANKLLNYGNDVLDKKETNASSFYLSIIEDFAVPTNQKERELVAKAYNNLAITFSDNKDYNKSIEYYHKATELNPNDWRVYASLGANYNFNKEYEKSLFYLNKSLEINATDPRTYTLLANTYMNNQAYKKALSFLKKAITIDNKYADAYLVMAFIYSKIGEHDKALKYVEKTALLGHKLDITYGVMASCLYYKKEYHKAIKFANKSLDINSEYTPSFTFRETAYQTLVSELKKNKQYEEAIKLYKKAIKEDKRNDVYPWASDIYGSQGLDYIFKKEFEKAIEPLKEAIRLNPEDGQYLNNLGYVYMRMKEYDKAIKFYNKALEVYSHYKSLKELPNWETYPPEIAKYLKYRKKNSYTLTYSQLGELYFTTKEYKKAVEVYEKYLEYDPNDENIKTLLNKARLRDK